MKSRPDSSTAEKYKFLQRHLIDEHVLIHIDPNLPEVQVPTYLKETPTLTLKLSRLFRGNLEVKEDRIIAELLFGQSYFTCCIPISAIWGITNVKGENRVWLDSAPQIVRNQADLAPQPKGTPQKKPRTKKEKSHLKRVK